MGRKIVGDYYHFNITAATSAFVLSSCSKEADGEVCRVKIDEYEDLEHINHALISESVPDLGILIGEQLAMMHPLHAMR